MSACGTSVTPLTNLNTRKGFLVVKSTRTPAAATREENVRGDWATVLCDRVEQCLQQFRSLSVTPKAAFDLGLDLVCREIRRAPHSQVM